MPLKIPVGRIGQWKHPKYGTIKMSQQTFDEMIRNFKEKTIGRDPFIRIGHDKGTDSTFGAAKAEGWIQDLVQEGDVLYALAEPTNPDIAEMVRTKQYRYASPEYVENYQSKEDGSFKGAVLEALALTNEPFLTRLPEARLLSDPPDTFYLDYEEVNSSMEHFQQLLEEQKQTNSFLRKLADWFMGKKPEDLGTPKTPEQKPTETDEQKKLAEFQAQLEVTNAKLRAAEVDRKLAEYVAKGIPPAICEQVRPILLADTGEKVIKLADGQMQSQSEQIYAMLDAFPESSRVKLGQLGEQTTVKPGSPEEIKKLCDQDMLELGYRIDEKTGKYIL